MSARIRKGDKVVVRAGRDRGKEGEVVKVLPSKGKALVQDVHVYRRHTKPSRNDPGGIVRKMLPIDLSNLGVKDPQSGKPTRVGFRLDKDGRKIRYAKTSGEPLI